jgi:hypothetical protein
MNKMQLIIKNSKVLKAGFILLRKNNVINHYYN